MEFRAAYAQGFARVAAVTLPVTLAEPERNVDATLEQWRACDADSVALAVFPELGLSGYSLEDLFLQDPLLDAVEAGLSRLVAASTELFPVAVVGAPLRARATGSSTARSIIHRGEILGVAPKSYLPTYREFYERRHFAPGDDQRGEAIRLGGKDVPFGPDLIFNASDVRGLSVHVEVCEDMWVPIPPSAEAALAGAAVLVNLSGSPITVAKSYDRKLLCESASSPVQCGIHLFRCGRRGIDH